MFYILFLPRHRRDLQSHPCIISNLNAAAGSAATPDHDRVTTVTFSS
jgi:hypothetical protein